MKTWGLLVVLGAMLSPLGAVTVEWTATGEVTGVVTEGGGNFQALGIGNGDQVEVELRYSSGMDTKLLNEFSIFWSEMGMYGQMGLEVSVTIGGHTWLGQVRERAEEIPITTPYAMIIGQASSLLNGDDITINLTSEGLAEFSVFPGESSTGVNSLTLQIEDTVQPYDFLKSTQPPQAMDPVLEDITAATGMVSAGGESISFVMDPATIMIVDDPVPVQVPVEIARQGADVVLFWDAEIGVEYTFHWSYNLRQWAVLNSFPAEVLEEMFVFPPKFNDPVQYYRVGRGLGIVIP